MSTSDGTPPRRPGAPPAPRPLPKRFYTAVSIGPVEVGGAALLLDGKVAKTPKRAELRLPTLALAQAVAGEWAAQDHEIAPARMPLTRLANTAIDGVTGRTGEVAADIVKYAGSDLVCYRAEQPQSLVRRQAELWDPVLTWAAEQFGHDFQVASGIVAVSQPDAALQAMATLLSPLDPFRLTGLHAITTLTGSALLALGVMRRAWSADDAWNAAHVDEDWQIAQWGEDAEARKRRQARAAEMLAAARMLALLE